MSFIDDVKATITPAPKPVIKMEYDEWDNLVQKVFPWLDDYSVVSDQELGNDSAWVTELNEGDDLRLYDLEFIWKNSSYISHTLAALLCKMGILPSDVTLYVDICW